MGSAELLVAAEPRSAKPAVLSPRTRPRSARGRRRARGRRDRVTVSPRPPLQPRPANQSSRSRAAPLGPRQRAAHAARGRSPGSARSLVEPVEAELRASAARSTKRSHSKPAARSSSNSGSRARPRSGWSSRRCSDGVGVERSARTPRAERGSHQRPRSNVCVLKSPASTIGRVSPSQRLEQRAHLRRAVRARAVHLEVHGDGDERARPGARSSRSARRAGRHALDVELLRARGSAARRRGPRRSASATGSRARTATPRSSRPAAMRASSSRPRVVSRNSGAQTPWSPSADARSPVTSRLPARAMPRSISLNRNRSAPASCGWLGERAPRPGRTSCRARCSSGRRGRPLGAVGRGAGGARRRRSARTRRRASASSRGRAPAIREGGAQRPERRRERLEGAR